MKLSGPLMTLLAVAALATVLFGINMSRGTASAPAPETAPPTTTTTTEPTTTTTVPPPVEEMFVGAADTGAAIAVAVKNDKAIAYLCDGQEVESWLEGTVQESTLSLRAKDGSELTGTIAGDRLTGTVLRNSFTANVVAPPAGLWRANAGVLDRIGWVVREDGSATGLRLKDGRVQAAPPFNPSSVTVDGKAVPVLRASP